MREKRGARLRRIRWWACGVVLAELLSGCGLPSAGRLTVRAIEGVGALTEKTAVAAVKTTGKLAVSSTKAVVSTAGKGTASVGSTAFVTFQDTATGLSRQVPYVQGLRLYTASQSAKIQAGAQAFEVLRQGRLLLAGLWSAVKPHTAQDLALRPGDVIRSRRGVGKVT